MSRMGRPARATLCAWPLACALAALASSRTALACASVRLLPAARAPLGGSLARMSLAPRAPSGCHVRERARAASARRSARNAYSSATQPASAPPRVVEVAGATVLAIPRGGRVRRLTDLLLLSRVKLDLDEAQFALRLAADFGTEPALLSDLDFGTLAARLDGSVRVVADELSARVLAPEEAASLSDRLRLDASALREAARAVSGTVGGTDPSAASAGSADASLAPPAPPLRLPLSRLDVPLILEVAHPMPALRLSNASALRAARNASSAALLGTPPGDDATAASKAARLSKFGRELWARLNGRRPDRLQQGLEREAGALSRLGRDFAALRTQLDEATQRAQALGDVLQRQGLSPLPTSLLEPAPAALAALCSQLAAATIAVQLDRAYAALEGELLALLSPQPGGHGGGSSLLESAAQTAASGADGAGAGAVAGGSGGGGSAEGGGGAKAVQAQLELLIAQLGSCEASLSAAQAALNAADDASCPAPASTSEPASAASAVPPQLETAQRDAAALLARLGLAVSSDEQWGPSSSSSKASAAPAEPGRSPSWQAVTNALSSALGQLRRGLAFYARGFQILAQDMKLAAALVLSAARGHTLNQREARAVRRTGKDVVMLVPFTALMLMPLSPLGHVLVFGFLQRVWPGFFPSAFTDSRQGMLDMYSGLLLSNQRASSGSAAQPPGVQPAGPALQ